VRQRRVVTMAFCMSCSTMEMPHAGALCRFFEFVPVANGLNEGIFINGTKMVGKGSPQRIYWAGSKRQLRILRLARTFCQVRETSRFPASQPYRLLLFR
jgi:hypothetical protein